MTSRTSARNISNQKFPETQEGRVTDADVGLFTATVKTKVLSVVGLLDAVGADATYAVAIKRGANFRPIGDMVAANGTSKFEGELILEIGDIITNVGDSGSTNGTMDMIATIQEMA